MQPIKMRYEKLFGTAHMFSDEYNGSHIRNIPWQQDRRYERLAATTGNGTLKALR